MFGLHLHNSRFTDLLFELSQNECEIDQYNTIQYKNSIAQYNLGIVQQPCTVYNMSITNYRISNFAYVHTMKNIFYRS